MHDEKMKLKWAIPKSCGKQFPVISYALDEPNRVLLRQIHDQSGSSAKFSWADSADVTNMRSYNARTGVWLEEPEILGNQWIELFGEGWWSECSVSLHELVP
jgi:hypothetical protein